MGPKVIGGRTFVFAKLPPAAAVPVAWKLMPLLPGLMKAAAGLAGAGKPSETGDAPSVADMTKAVAAMSDGAQIDAIVDALTRVSGEDVVLMMRSVFKSVHLAATDSFGNIESSVPLDLDIHFGAGISMDMFKVFAEALRVNFGGFLGVARSPSSPAEAVT